MNDKLVMVKQYLFDNVSITALYEKYRYDIAKIKYYIRLYELHGEGPFSEIQEKRVYTREEKLRAIKIVLAGDKSARTLAVEIGLPNPGVLQDWIVMYKSKGEDAIQVSTGRKQYLLHEDRQILLAEQELNDRLKYLEAENDYLKKSYALILEKNKRLKRK